MERTTIVFFVATAFVVAAIASSVDWEFVVALDFSVPWKYRRTLLRGYGVTLAFAAGGASLGLVLGTVLAMISQSPLRAVRWLVAGYVEFWRNTPLLVQLFWIHFAFPFITGLNTTANQTALLAMTLNIGAYYAEIVRAGIEAVPHGQWEAAYALGLPAGTRWRRVILPQALRIMVPPTVNLMLSIFKATAILSLLTIGELMRETNRISNFTFKPVEMYTVAAVIYAVTGLVISFVSLRIERRFQRSDR